MTYRTEYGIKKYRFTQEKARKAWNSIPKEQRLLIRDAVHLAANGRRTYARRALDEYAVARYRQSGKAARDLAADGRRRRLVGARLPIDQADRVKAAAAATGRSVYRFVADAIEHELTRANYDGQLF